VIQPYLWVNTRGERFYDEGEFDFPHIGNATANQPGELMFVVFDENTKKYMMEKGIDIGVGVHVPVATKLTELDALLDRGIKKGEAWSDDTISGLAKKMKVPVKNFVATVEQYNFFCDKRHDSLFAKDPKYLQPVKTPPFYAVRGFPTNAGTVGGIKINFRTEVLDRERAPIPGLYVAGNDAGGLYGDTYDAVKAGLTLGFAVNSGIIAAENALKFIGK
jgi:fumarate reductase flavoprotein subunit